MHSIGSRATTLLRRSFSTSAALRVGRQRATSARLAPFADFDINDLEEFRFDDQTTMGHEMITNIREIRSYLRKAKYEIPTLEKYRQEFVPPKPSQIICLKTHNYMGESHPVERKVVATIKVDSLGLTPVERHKFLLLCGPRYNPEKEEVCFSCERFPYQSQNRKYVSDLVERLLAEAKDKTDTFEDIPLDLRHVKQKKVKLEFPKEWERPVQKAPKNETANA
ncbi:mitochondrial 37S ribosomal protein mS35 [Calcarisporiella thermophila]|uniref:mitochondrial 37S ribosomal protein mS35 n=1 Tax=Calcarisporiella thermophila TaxID=911321 RepID=UPI00374285DB